MSYYVNHQNIKNVAVLFNVFLWLNILRTVYFSKLNLRCSVKRFKIELSLHCKNLSINKIKFLVVIYSLYLK